MVGNKVDAAIEQFRRDELSQQEFKKTFRRLEDENGGNWFTISGAISGELARNIYTDEFREEVRQLAIDANEKHGDNLGSGYDS